MLKLVVDTCIVKMASFPAENNPAALIVQMGLSGLYEWWVTPAILDEYADVMGSVLGGTKCRRHQRLLQRMESAEHL